MNKNLINISELSKNDIDELIAFAEQFYDGDGGCKRENIFPDKTIANVFFEPSTRTKLSFEIAAKNLGCQTINFDIKNSSMKKGESVFDTIDTVSLMGVDMFIIRSSEPILAELANMMPGVKFINAGEGTESHPTQTLTDFLTIKQTKDTLNNLKIAIVGDLDHSRVARSFLNGISNYEENEIVLTGHPDLCSNFINNDKYHYVENLDDALKDADIVMALRIQHERIQSSTEIDIDEYKALYQVNSERMELAKGDAILMHPGPVNMDIEVSESLYHSDKSVIRDQVSNGVAIRMAVLSRFLS